MAKKSPSDLPRAPRRRAVPTVGPGATEATQTARSAMATDASVEFGSPTASEEEIARRAYEIYTERGGRDGYDLDDWLQAERELREARSGSWDNRR